MKYLLGASLSLAAVLLAADVSMAAKCADEDPDGSRVAAARAQVEADCNCAAAADHGTYVECASGVANDRSKLDADDPLRLPNSCKGRVKKCAARSTCGKPGFVTCCIPKGDGTTKCRTKKSAEKCADKGGTAGTCSSCCDACGSPAEGPSCPVPTTTTTLPVPTTLPVTTTIPTIPTTLPVSTTLPDIGALLR